MLDALHKLVAAKSQSRHRKSCKHYPICVYVGARPMFIPYVDIHCDDLVNVALVSLRASRNIIWPSLGQRSLLYFRWDKIWLNGGLQRQYNRQGQYNHQGQCNVSGHGVGSKRQYNRPALYGIVLYGCHIRAPLPEVTVKGNAGNSNTFCHCQQSRHPPWMVTVGSFSTHLCRARQQ